MNHLGVIYAQGAERKTRDEERRAAKRKMTATGRKKLDELYHSVTERSEFYSMVDLHKPPVLFSPPAEHTIDKVLLKILIGWKFKKVFITIHFILLYFLTLYGHKHDDAFLETQREDRSQENIVSSLETLFHFLL